MAKLYFRFGAMGSGKTIDLLKVAYNYKERGQDVVLYTAEIDNRYEVGKITARIGLQADAKTFNFSLYFSKVTNFMLSVPISIPV